MTTVAAIFAHQGGWDEALLIAGPLLLIAGLLWLAKRRVDRAADAAASTPGEPSAPGEAPTPGEPSTAGEPGTATESRTTTESSTTTESD